MAKKKTQGPDAAASAPPNPAPEQTAPTRPVPGERAPPSVPVVGIGASAGGLEAFEAFLAHVPPASGMAYVLVQHLDPTHSSLLGELLQRRTPMPVREATDRMRIEPDQVYVIPPNQEMTLLHGELRLAPPALPRGLRMPIDLFLRSLAAECGEQAMGVVLSGNGADGTGGMHAILAAGGIGLVQDPQTARFAGMPSRAIQLGHVTAVLPVERMAAVLVSMRATLRGKRSGAAAGIAQVLAQLRAATGHDFSQYKRSTIGRRIGRRMAQHQILAFDAYARYLRDHPAEANLLLGDLLINVTAFFRDTDAWAALAHDALPALLREKAPGDVFRVWVAGGSTGEEAYSVAMLLREAMDEGRCEPKVQIYSTDLDADAVAAARTGRYPSAIEAGVPPARLQRFFSRDDTGYRVKKDLRDMVVFAVQNVLTDPPFTRLDLLCCRNLMIYLEAPLQLRLLPVFHYALRPGGVLFLSPSETVGVLPELFSTLNRRWRLFRAVPDRRGTRPRISPATVPAPSPEPKTTDDAMRQPKDINPGDLARRALLQSYAPASVVTDVDGEILFVHGDTGSFLRPAPGQPSLNVVDMAREGLQMSLRLALRAAARGEGTERGEAPGVHFSVGLLNDAGAGKRLLLVSFFNEPAAGAKTRRPGPRKGTAEGAARIAELERALFDTRESLQASLEAAQASNEELKSANEEMQSTNEELQSTNEELETSKEELQSVNEELVTVNAELQQSIEQLAGMQNDMKNLLDNINIGTIFLDDKLVIRRFTKEAARAYRLVASDVGRPLADIKCDLQGADLLADARAVIDTLVPSEREVSTAAGATYLARMQPYRTLDNAIEGVVVTFTDISHRVEAGRVAGELRALAEGIVNTVREPLLVLDAQLRVVSASRSFYRDFELPPAETVGRPIDCLGAGEWNIPGLRGLLETVLPRDQSFDGFELERPLPGGGRQHLVLNARRVIGAPGMPPLILLAIELTPASAGPRSVAGPGERPT